MNHTKELLFGFMSTLLVLVFVVWQIGMYISKTTSSSSVPSNILNIVATHNTSTDCWMSIHGKVYDVTAYLSKHPAGAAVVIPFCGKDASVAFDAIKDGKGHSEKANQILSSLEVNLMK